MKKEKRRIQSGVVLIEVMVAAAVLVMGIVSVLGMHFKSLKKNERTKNLMKAAIIMENEIAGINAADFTGIADYKKTYELEESVYECYVSVKDEKALPLKRVSISLLWEENFQKKRWEEEVLKPDLG